MTDCPWDLNGDGVVDDADFAIFKLAYESVIGDSNWNQACDFNGDGEVGFDDFTEFSSNYGPCPGVTPPPSEITCNEATPNFPSGCELLKYCDKNDNHFIDGDEFADATLIPRGDYTGILLTDEERLFVRKVYREHGGDINSLCPGCYATPPPPPPVVCTPGATRCYADQVLETCKSDGTGWIRSTCYASKGLICKDGACVPVDTTPPVTPPENETRTTLLTEGNHQIQVSLSGYNTLNATINVSSTGVTCVSVIGGACGGSSLPRISTSGWTVTTYLKEGAEATNRCTWIATKDTSKVAFISEMVLAYNDLANIGFTPSASEIGQAVLMYANLGTPESLWGC